jgi:hypothetical protein
MIPASGAGGREFDSRITPFFCLISFFVNSILITSRKRVNWSGHIFASMVTKKELNQAKKRWKKSLVRTGTRTQNLLLRRQAPYPLGHTDINDIRSDPSPVCTCHSSLGVEHPLSKRKVVGSNPACGSLISFLHSRSFLGRGGEGGNRRGRDQGTDPTPFPENPRFLL